MDSMETDQRNARIFGVLFIVTFLASIPAYLLFGTAVDDPAGYLERDRELLERLGR